MDLKEEEKKKEKMTNSEMDNNNNDDECGRASGRAVMMIFLSYTMFY